ncbi:MAG: SipW-dependent-type signal peptide-containing protein [Oscillospiraceae bacterium]|nr:SipW-dependent-type signal peptide-containing protein [Oscillospiraceae bacterium]
MKKKGIIALCLIAAIGAVLTVGGTLAWFSDTDEATNTFTVGSVEIRQNEVFDPTTAQLIPVGSNTTPEDDDNFIQKEVTVKNTGRNPAYVQTFAAVPADLDNHGILHIHGNATGGWIAVDGDLSTAEIDPCATAVTVNGNLCNIYKFRNENPLAVNAETAPAMLGVYVDQAADINVYRNAADENVIDHAYFVMNGAEVTSYDVASMTLNVYVATQGVQSEGFADAATALDSAFPNHPWATAP